MNKDWRIALSFLWLGFIGAISFLEAWLKFKAPGITIELGLGIGRLVFQSLNKIEWLIILLILINSLLLKVRFNLYHYLIPILLVVILLIDTFYLLPQLDFRAEMIIKGMNPGHSYLHLIYIGLEIYKALCLLLFSYLLNKNIISNYK